MIGPDIPFPQSEFDMIRDIKLMNLIYPLDHPMSVGIRIDMTIRMLSFDDNEYGSFMADDITSSDMTALDGKFFQINYIRETTLRNVAKFEWDLHFGPDNPKTYLKVIKKTDPDMFVKIINLKALSYSLTEFDKHYGKLIKR